MTSLPVVSPGSSSFWVSVRRQSWVLASGISGVASKMQGPGTQPPSENWRSWFYFCWSGGKLGTCVICQRCCTSSTMWCWKLTVPATSKLVRMSRPSGLQEAFMAAAMPSWWTLCDPSTGWSLTNTMWLSRWNLMAKMTKNYVPPMIAICPLTPQIMMTGMSSFRTR